MNPSSGVEISFVPAYSGEPPYSPGMFPQLWCPNGTYSEYGILFFKPIDQVLSTMIQFEVWNRVAMGELWRAHTPTLNMQSA